jgi:hypothetical protein
MKKSWLTMLAASVVLAGSAAAYAATAAEMGTCFPAYGHLMARPAVTNIRACWQAHGYLR